MTAYEICFLQWWVVGFPQLSIGAELIHKIIIKILSVGECLMSGEFL
jgi:hypothetical protein